MSRESIPLTQTKSPAAQEEGALVGTVPFGDSPYEATEKGLGKNARAQTF